MRIQNIILEGIPKGVSLRQACVPRLRCLG